MVTTPAYPGRTQTLDVPVPRYWRTLLGFPPPVHPVRMAVTEMLQTTRHRVTGDSTSVVWYVVEVTYSDGSTRQAITQSGYDHSGRTRTSTLPPPWPRS